MKVTALTVFLSYVDSLDIETQKRVKDAVKEMKESKSLQQLTSARKMKNSTYYRKRIGKYRLLFEWQKQEQQIVLYKVELRKDAYKKR